MLLDLVEEALGILERTAPVVRLGASRALFVGDLHGYPDVLRYVERELEDRDMRVVFMGDYVDRGPRQIEVLERVLGILAAYPDRVVLLRGNHEDEYVNRIYGFYEVFSRRFGAEKYARIKELYAAMPVAAAIGNVFAVHGGIPVVTREPNKALEGLRKAESGTSDEIREFLRNDPNEEIEHHRPSPRGEGIYEFGRVPFEQFMSAYGFKAFIRGHQVFFDGYKRLFGGRMLTIVSYPPNPRVAEVYFHEGEPIIRVARPRIY